MGFWKIFGRKRPEHLAGLALASGGAKGLAHVAVIEEIERLGIGIQCLAGSSIGAVVASVYACGSLGRFKKAMLALTRRDMLGLADFTIPKNGLLKGKRIMEFLGQFIPADTRIESLPLPLAIVVTDFATGRRAVFTSGLLLPVLRASLSIPGVFVPVVLDGRICIDGGAASVLPVDIPRLLGARRVIAVGLHPGPRASGARGLPVAEPLLRYSGSGLDKKGPDLPGIVSVVAQSIDITDYATEAAALAACRPDVAIFPEVSGIGVLEFDAAEKAFTAGRAAVARVAPELLRL